MNLKIKYMLPILLLFSTSIVSAGILDWFDFTGRATTGTHNISIELENINPAIEGVSTIPPQSITEDGSSAITFNFQASDADGVTNLNDTTAIASFQRAGEITRTTSCSLIEDIDGTTANYTCTIDIWYFDGAGSWTINVTITDVNDASTEDLGSSFTLGETTAMTFAPNALSFSGATSPATTDTLADQNALINNTGNDEIISGGLTVTAINLVGETDDSKIIYGGNFTVHTAAACSVGTTMANGTAIGVTGATLPKGNHSLNDGSTGQEQLFYCLEAMNTDLTEQDYTTSTGGPWSISIS